MNVCQGPALSWALCYTRHMFSPVSGPGGVGAITFLSQVKKGQLIWARPPSQGVEELELECSADFCACHPSTVGSRKWAHPNSQGPSSLQPYPALLYLCDGHRALSYLCFLICKISMFLPTETNPFPENAEFTYTHEGWGVSFLNKNALQKHKTAGHRGDYRAGLHSQDDVTRDGGMGHPQGPKVSPGATELGIKP